MLTALRVAAVVEASSLLLLVVNLATLHLGAVASLVGPLHGTAYLTVIATAMFGLTSGRARWRALIPGIGGLLSWRATSSPGRPGAVDSDRAVAAGQDKGSPH